MLDLLRPKLQRARGAAKVGFCDGRLKALAQSGSAKVMLPSTHSPVPEAVFLNTAGGLTGGDVFEFSARVEGGALSVTTQTAERAYASTGEPAEVFVELSAGPGACLHWLPQETILFNSSALRRRTRIEAAPGARILALETLVLGRGAMGEQITCLSLEDRREILREGAPIWVDALRLDETLIGEPAGLADARAFTTLVLCAQDAEDVAAALSLPDGLVMSAWNERLVLRGAFPDLWPLKAALAPVLRQLTGARLPRVWAV